MKTKLLLSLVVFSFVFSGLKAQVDVGDSLALVDLYNNTGGANWYGNYNWLSKRPVRRWYGVQVGNGNRVINIRLSGNNLRGVLPASIGNLTALTILFLDQNVLVASLPETIGNLGSLQILHLSDNRFSGAILSSVGGMQRLVDFYCERNNLRGDIPQEFGNCPYLNTFQVDENHFTGTIPPSFNYLRNLVILHASHNDLSGPVPELFNGVAPIYDLNLSYNNLTGSIPDDVYKEENLNYLILSHNHISGKLPALIGRLQKLQTIDVSDNEMTGTIPTSLVNDPYLFQLILTNNHFIQTKNVVFEETWRSLAISIDSNNFTFNGVEYIAKVASYSQYSPQAILSISKSDGKLAVSAGGTLSNNTYTWFRIGKGSGNVVVGDSTFTPIESGSYYCSITNKVATQLILYTDTVTYITNPIVKKELNISLSPNPARGMISIYDLNEKSNAKITIADMSGYVWMSMMSREKTSLQVDVSRLKVGNYLVNVSDGNDAKTIEFVKE